MTAIQGAGPPDAAWAEGLVQAVRQGNAKHARRLVKQVQMQPDTRSDLLTALAVDASAGSSLAVELLIEVVDDVGVARAAVRRFLVDPSAVDDVTQDTLISMARSIESFRGDSRFTTWLHQIAKRRAADHLRRIEKHAKNEPLPQRGGLGSGTSQERSQAVHHLGEARRLSSLIATRQAVQELVAQLPLHYRQAVALRDIENLPYAEIAARMQRNLNTVKSLVARGRAQLAQKAQAGGLLS